MQTESGALLTVSSLKQRLERLGAAPEDDFTLLHASWDNDKGFHERHIPTACSFDGLKCVDDSSVIKNTLPKADDFAKYVESLGIGNNTHVVIYEDNVDVVYAGTAARVWQMFRIFGHDLVSVLDGGLFAWISEGGATESGPSQSRVNPNTKFVPHFREELVVALSDVSANLQHVSDSNFRPIVDARPRPAFSGAVELFGAKGHVPHAVNVPGDCIVDPDSRKFKKVNELRQLFLDKNIDITSQPLISMCGMGLKACSINLAAFLAGNQRTALFDGSWCEWSLRKMPIELP